MIKRPMLGLAAAWLLGLIFARAQLPVDKSTIVIYYGILILFLFFCLWKWPRRLDSYVTPKRYPQMTIFLLLLPCLFFAGSRRMEKEMLLLEELSAPWQQLEADGEDYVFVKGLVKEKLCEEDSVILVLGDCTITGYGESGEVSASNGIVAGGCRVSIDQEGRGYLPETFVGNYVRVYGKFLVYRSAGNPGQFDSFSYYSSKGQYASVKAKRIDVLDDSINRFGHAMFVLKQEMRSVFSMLYPGEKAGVLTAMLLGDKDLLDTEVKELYQQNGISHILAISGLHISMLCMGLYGILRKAGVPIWAASPFSVLFLIFYICFTGASTSSLRAGVMCLVLIFGRLLRRSYDLLSSLAVAAIVVTMIRPMELTSAGFLLSFGAVLGVALAQVVADRMQEECQAGLIHGWITFLQPFIFGGMIQLFTIPISLWFYYELSPYSVFLNLIIIPLASLIMGGGLASLVLGMIWPFPARFVAGGSYLLLDLYEWLGSLVQKLPYSFVLIGRPTVWQMVLYYALLLISVWWFCSRKKEGKSSGSVRFMFELVACVFLLLFPYRSSFVLQFLDVSQGDGILVFTEEQKTLLFDGGSTDVKQLGTYRIAPVLKQEGIAIIDTVAVSHMDSDHYSGVLEFLESMPVFVDERTFWQNYKGEILIRELVLPMVSEPSEEYEQLVSLALSKNVGVRYIEAGGVLYAEEGLFVECLSPVEAQTSENDTSLVFLLQTPELVVWLMGDAGVQSELDLMEQLARAWNVDVDCLDEYCEQKFTDRLCVLKVGHHGSKTSSGEAFVKFVNPDVAVISCGYQNSYGHPHDSVLKTLEDCGCFVFRTDLQGAVKVENGPRGEGKVSVWRENIE